MLEKTSVSMMVLLVASSLIGIAGIYQYEEGQVPPTATSQPQPRQQAKVKDIVGVAINSIDIYASSDGKACIAKYSFLAPDQIVSDLHSVALLIY